MVADSSPPTQPILLVTGMSGAGKTTALRELEDIGWEAIDNFPIRLLDRLVSRDAADDAARPAPLAIGFDTRTRGFVPRDIIEQVKALAARNDLQITTLFIDCAESELVRRYNENRRRHPLAGDRPVTDGIRAENELLAPLRRWADIVVATTDLSTNQLQARIREQFATPDDEAMSVIVTSFGFARGMPPVADLVFDMRYLDNPHWRDELREQTGLDRPVQDYIEGLAVFRETFADMRDLVLKLLPHYRAQGKRYVTIAFGCTGGRHRSVYSAEKLGAALRDAGFAPTTLHRNLTSRAASLVEGEHAI